MVSFCDKLGKKFVVTGEVEPAAAVNRGFLEKAKKYLGYADAINVIDSPLAEPQVSSLAASLIIRNELGIEPVLQMCARDRNKTAIINDLLGAKLLGLDDVLCIAGDYPAKKEKELVAKPVYELDSVRLARLVKEEMPQLYEGFKMNVGVAYNPMAEPSGPQEAALEKKLKWADFVQTQPVYDFSQLKNTVVKAYKDRILVGVMPLLDKKTGEYFNKNLPGFDISKEVLDRIETPDDGIELAREMIRKARSEDFAGVHLMVFGEAEDRIGEILG